MSDYDPRHTPWHLDESEFYELESRTDQVNFLISWAVLAPSSHNTQPWTFRITDDGVEISADFTRRLPVADPEGRELFISLGAAITNLRVAAAHFGFETSVLYESDAESAAVAVVTLRETCDADASLRALFPSIAKRHTNRQPFVEREIDPHALTRLCDFVEDNSELHFVLPHDVQRAARLIEEGDRLLMANTAFRDEIAHWLRPNAGSARDGMCGDAIGIPGPLSALGPWMIRQFDMSGAQARFDRSLAEKAAGLIVVTAYDDRLSLVRAGELLERLLLLLTTLSIDYSFLNQPVQVPALRHSLWSMIRSATPPQLLVRFGYAPAPVQPMPRRPVDAVVQ
ncbi:MAG TPA: hypothetical protein VMS98_08090 [Thermoanaerobaculia bacterium]|nr:hypothetical protein [Thermoanaerobaculia bacterium]